MVEGGSSYSGAVPVRRSLPGTRGVHMGNRGQEADWRQQRGWASVSCFVWFLFIPTGCVFGFSISWFRDLDSLGLASFGAG